MRRIFIILPVVILVVSCSKEVNENILMDEGGVKFEPNADKPFTGKAFELYEGGEKKLRGTYKEGLMNGKWTYWYKNGNKMKEGHYRNSEENGLWTYWYDSGQKKMEGTYTKDKKVGEWTYWNEIGEVEKVEQYEDDKIMETSYPK